MKSYVTLISIIGILIMISVTGCANHRYMERRESDGVTSEADLAPLKVIENPRYVILPGDEIEIKLPYHSEYNERLEVLPDGKIYLPLVNEIPASGKTPGEFAAQLKEAYSSQLKNPEVSVIVRKANGRFTYVGGEVKNPQAVSLNLPVTLLQAVIRCGDVLSSAHERNVLILRSLPNGVPQAITVDLRAVRKGESADVSLEPYDIVYVPKTAIANVGNFIEAYINRIIPRSVSFPFVYELNYKWKGN